MGLPAEAWPSPLPTLRETWSTTLLVFVLLRRPQSAWAFSQRNGSPLSTPRLVLLVHTCSWLVWAHSSAQRSSSSWSTTSMSVLVCSLFSPLLSSRLVLTGLHLSIKNLMMGKLLLDLSGSPRLTSARMLLHKRSLARPTLLPGKTLLLLRRKLLVCSWRECIGLGCSLPTLRSRKGWTTSWRLPTL